jgi:hypothetical protein
MNYENYIEKLVRGKGVGLVNWPAGVDFKRMSLQSAIGPLQTLLDSLKSGTTRWKKLTAAEKEKLIAQYEEMVDKGEVAGKKSRSMAARKAKKAAVVEGDEDEEDEEAEGEEDEDEEEAARAGKPAGKGKSAATSSKRGAKSAKAVGEGANKGPVRARKAATKTAARTDNSSDESGDDDPPAPKRPGKRKRTAPEAESRTKRSAKRTSSKGASMRDKLRALVQKGREANDAASVKRKRERARAACDGNESDEEGDEGAKRKRGRARAAHDGGGSDEEGGEGKERGSRKRTGDKGEGRAKRGGKKVRKTAGGEDAPAMQPARPQPKALYKKKPAAPATDDAAPAPPSSSRARGRHRPLPRARHQVGG